MTEADWLNSDHIAAMLIHLRGELPAGEKTGITGLQSSAGLLAPGPTERATPGRLRAFAATCLPWWRELPFDPPSAAALDAYAAYLDGTDTRDAFRDACFAIPPPPPEAPGLTLGTMNSLWDDTPYGVGKMTWNLTSAYAGYVARGEIAELTRGASEDDRFGYGFFGYGVIPLWRNTVDARNASFPPLLRETVGNPFRPVAFRPEWRTATVLALAEGVYAERAFDRLMVLADALEEAGCDAAALLAHLRGSGPHVRGCWAVDLVLGKC